MKHTINWGIIGLGKIATKFAYDLQLSETSTLYAVASRSIEKAKDFAKNYNAITYYDSYEALANNPEIDVIYIATPHPFHFENTMMCLQKGKAVLCEKPIGMNRSQTQTMIQEAKKQQVFLMEGIWTRFIPATEKVLELIENDTIGTVNFIRADFGFTGNFSQESRVYNKKLGAGSLLDIGIYPIYLSLLILGIPTEIKAMARMTHTDVDSYCSMLFDYSNTAKANLESTIEAQTPTEAYIYGSKGTLKLHTRFHHTQKLSLIQNEQETLLDIPYIGNGYFHEIEEVNHCILKGYTESAKLPLSLSYNLSTLLDKVREKIGLNYE
ncbi:inositol 2-dehydrogenase [Flavobacteriaceae bacterium UJ101]|nr:inositol 2-dehydrogenase [Flavobacteriaceae bacterium UJ101]